MMNIDLYEDFICQIEVHVTESFHRTYHIIFRKAELFWHIKNVRSIFSLAAQQIVAVPSQWVLVAFFFRGVYALALYHEETGQNVSIGIR